MTILLPARECDPWNRVERNATAHKAVMLYEDHDMSPGRVAAVLQCRVSVVIDALTEEYRARLIAESSHREGL